MSVVYVTYIHTYINKFITRSIVKQSSNQRRGQSLGGGGSLGDEGIKIKWFETTLECADGRSVSDGKWDGIPDARRWVTESALTDCEIGTRHQCFDIVRWQEWHTVWRSPVLTVPKSSLLGNLALTCWLTSRLLLFHSRNCSNLSNCTRKTYFVLARTRYLLYMQSHYCVLLLFESPVFLIFSFVVINICII